MKVSALTTYPIKSTTGISFDKISVYREGLDLDRSWAVVDKDGGVITGRQNTQILAFSSKIRRDYLEVYHQKDSIQIPLSVESSRALEVKVFSSTGFGLEISDETSNWFSERLNQVCKFVVFDPNNRRQIQEKHGGEPGELVKFADMNPILLVSEASLEDLNSRLESPVSMRNFRPNIVIRGCEPFDEDTWKKLRIGSCTFKVVQQCERCVFTTIDPDTLEKNKNSEPLKTLSKYRRTASGGVAFGMHLIPEQLGTLNVGDPVVIMN